MQNGLKQDSCIQIDQFRSRIYITSVGNSVENGRKRVKAVMVGYMKNHSIRHTDVYHKQEHHCGIKRRQHD
jgi:hypothetical protein